LLIDSPAPNLIYLDPPYFDKGGVCYQHSFTQEHHERLAKKLRSTFHHWVLSYDDCPAIRDLYNWARIKVVAATYSMSRKTVGELIITKT